MESVNPALLKDGIIKIADSKEYFSEGVPKAH
jgi:hypothetical protein